MSFPMGISREEYIAEMGRPTPFTATDVDRACVALAGRDAIDALPERDREYFSGVTLGRAEADMVQYEFWERSEFTHCSTERVTAALAKEISMRVGRPVRIRMTYMSPG